MRTAKHPAFDATRRLADTADGTMDAHRRSLEPFGYAVLRSLIDRDVVRAARDAMLRLLVQAGLISRNGDDLYEILNPVYSEEDARLLGVLQASVCQTEIYDIVSQRQVREFFTDYFHEEVLIHPIVVPRVVFPTPDELLWTLVSGHQDYSSIQGDPRFLTVWVPLDDCPDDVGPLRLALGTHNSELFDYRIAETGGFEAALPDTTEWASTELQAGDCLCFASHVVHSPTQNVSNRLRLSIDFRVQPASGVLSTAAIPQPLYLYGVPASRVFARVKNDVIKYSWLRANTMIVPFDNSLVRGYRMTIEEAVQALQAGDTRVLPVIYKLCNHGSSASIRARARQVISGLGIRSSTDIRVWVNNISSPSRLSAPDVLQ